MIQPIPPIAAGAVPVDATRLVEQPATSGAADPAGGFGDLFTGMLEDLDSSQKQTDALARSAATGDLEHVEDLMVAMNETQLATQLTVAVRNRAVEAFTEIMRMQL
jgi:flagellar hook-basal body complex protein FliE